MPPTQAPPASNAGKTIAPLAPGWQRAAVSSRANCMACHARADQGDFEDVRVHISC